MPRGNHRATVRREAADNVAFTQLHLFFLKTHQHREIAACELCEMEATDLSGDTGLLCLSLQGAARSIGNTQDLFLQHAHGDRDNEDLFDLWSCSPLQSTLSSVHNWSFKIRVTAAFHKADYTWSIAKVNVLFVMYVFTITLHFICCGCCFY